MPTLTLRPTGTGTYTELTPSAGTNWSCVDEAVVNDADYVSNGTLNSTARDTYQMADHTIEIGIINSVTVYFRPFTGDTNTVAPMLRLGTTDVTGTPTTGAPTTRSELLARPGGGNWSWTDIDNLESGTSNYHGNNISVCRSNWLYISVDYISSETIFAYFLL
jgi:hypothetical protein